MARLKASVAQLVRDLTERRPTTTAGLLTIVLVAVAKAAGVDLSEEAAGAIVAAVILVVGSLSPRQPKDAANVGPASDDLLPPAPQTQDE